MEPDRAVRGPWGVPATIAFTLLIAGGFLMAQSILAVPYLLLTVREMTESAVASATASLQTDGLFLGIAETGGGMVVLVLTLAATWARQGPTVRDYLGLRWVSRGEALRWLFFACLLLLLLEGAARLTDHPSVPVWLIDVYRSARWMPLFFFAIVVVAPVIEELVFRGFLFEGLRRSRLGEMGTVLVTSLVFASIHVQYELFFVGQVLAIGLLLAVARARTGSVLLTIAMHALVNAVAMLQLVLEMG